MNEAAAVLKYAAIAARCSLSSGLTGGALTERCTCVCTSIATKLSMSMAVIIPAAFLLVMNAHDSFGAL